MRTADEIMKSEIFQKTDTIFSIGDFRLIEKAIHSSQKEAIEECAKRAITKNSYAYNGEGAYPYNVVDKQSILTLINELK